jgi:LPPG:FO 2-phospho-L-lactate transferase
MSDMLITVLSGGVGGARFISGLLRAISPDDEVTVIGNTADDIWLGALRVCPDLDTVMYTLGGGIDPERKWGRTNETWHAKEELALYGAEQAWFGLGDRDLATHLLRSGWLRQGVGLAEVTARLCQRWQPGVRLLPMTEHEVETHVTTDDGVIHFQEYWIRLRASVAVRGLEFRGAAHAAAGPGVVEAIMGADVVILPPSNPIVSTGAILSVAQIADAVRSTPAPVVGVSPIIGGGAVRGMADQLLSGLGIEISAGSVARHFGARARGGLIDAWLIDQADHAQLPSIEAAGISASAVPLYMNDDETTAALAADTLRAAGVLA